MMNRLIVLILGAAVGLSAHARRSDTINLRAPLDIPLVLSGNFGELRQAHFHSGVDFKTQGKTGFPVFAVDDGYVSRVTVGPWGFGRAVYLVHPATGLTTVYGHLESFSPEIDKTVRKKQYEQETFSIDVSFNPGEIPVKRGDVIARSGNAGSSGGPHLHFDVRDTKTEHPLDPLEYYKGKIKDNVAPEVRQLALYPYNGGVVENSGTAGSYRQPGNEITFTAWGGVVPGIKAYDKMTGTANIYGVKYLTLTVDGDTVYRRVIDEYSFDDTRAIHTIINNADLVDKSSWIMTTRVPASNPLGKMIAAKNDGIIDINEERDYKMVWILQDEHGNVARQPFSVKGKRQLTDIPVAKGQLMLWDADNVYDDGVYVEMPKGALYENEFVNVTHSPSANYLSEIYSVGSPSVPLAKSYELTIPLTEDTLQNKKQYVIVRINGNNKSAETTTYSDGLVSAKPSRFGKFAVTTDKTAPVIKPLDKEKWRTTKKVKFKISDNLSGIEDWRGEIDGKWALFEFDGKTGTLWFLIDSERFPGTSHKVDLTVTDAAGNKSTYSGDF